MLVAQWYAGGGELPPPAEDIAITAMLIQFWKWAEQNCPDVARCGR